MNRKRAVRKYAKPTGMDYRSVGNQPGRRLELSAKGWSGKIESSAAPGSSG